jgi:hypothetical protein
MGILACGGAGVKGTDRDTAFQRTRGFGEAFPLQPEGGFVFFDAF